MQISCEIMQNCEIDIKRGKMGVFLVDGGWRTDLKNVPNAWGQIMGTSLHEMHC